MNKLQETPSTIKKTTVFQNEPLRFAKPGLLRFVLHFFEGIANFFGLLKSYAPTAHKSFITPDLKNRIQQIPEDGKTHPAIHQLAHNHYLAPSAIVAVADRINDSNGQTEVLTSYLFPNTVETVAGPSKTVVVIPIIFKKRCFPLRDHIVTVTVSTTDKTISFYDPQGYTIAERLNRELVSGGNLKDFLENIRGTYLENKDITILENIQKNQHDFHSCGVYALTAMMQAATHDNNQYDPSLPPLTLRERLVTYIVDHPRDGYIWDNASEDF